MTDRNAVKRLIETQGSAAARYQFGDAVVTDVMLKGISADLRTPTVTHDCGCGGTCGCGGHGHIHPAHTNDRAARRAARRAALANAVRAGVADAIASHDHERRMRAFLQSGRRAG
ncbi:hypothetical protein Mrad2831_1989 [Methylobacterium radiotolerans JCM 2831]|uniref:Uncharacterized protein n=1 Tax=Methylobacterium radiotolerans (strain ATCC 27329 / DSM 1819 / JCM 2831 / NBRC 15690 / NCIMB 10815 / 0-1) TaxID=426355 RepID=B1LUG6_METRJ|nr:hypothetical protein Mrad2831_1989 [Methylobacterium radiotolerans JCM 2831]GEM97444.1 hypothetical protein MRA01_19840 [Methylobacterium radiotolerans]